jgi:hypothetical protein
MPAAWCKRSDGRTTGGIDDGSEEEKRAEYAVRSVDAPNPSWVIIGSHVRMMELYAGARCDSLGVRAF